MERTSSRGSPQLHLHQPVTAPWVPRGQGESLLEVFLAACPCLSAVGGRAVAVSPQGGARSPLCPPRRHWRRPPCGAPLDTEGSTHTGGSTAGTGRALAAGELAARAPRIRTLGRGAAWGVGAGAGLPRAPHAPGGWSPRSSRPARCPGDHPRPDSHHPSREVQQESMNRSVLVR